jgi:hypothetical protein
LLIIEIVVKGWVKAPDFVAFYQQRKKRQQLRASFAPEPQ